MYIRPTMVPVANRGAGIKEIGDVIVNAAKKKVDSSRTWMDRLLDFLFRSEPEIRKLYAGRTEELLQKMVGCMAREATISCVPSSDPKSQGKPVYQYTIEEIDLTFEATLSPQYLTPRALCSVMINRGKITDPGNYPAGGNEQAMVYGFKEPRTIGMNPVELRNNRGHVVEAWTDGKILYTPPQEYKIERNIDTEAICYCLEHNLTPVRANSQKSKDGNLQICVSNNNIHAPDSPVRNIKFSSDSSSDEVIVTARCHPLEGLELARTVYGGTNTQILIDQYPRTNPPSSLSPKDSSEIIQELEKQGSKLWVMQKTVVDNKNTSLLILCDQSCGTPASFALLVDSSDATKMAELENLIRKNENLSTSMIRYMLAAEQVFDDDITEQIDAVIKMTEMGTFTVKELGTQGNYYKVEIGNPVNQEVTTLTLSRRLSSAQEGRGFILTDALNEATDEIKNDKMYIRSDRFSEELKTALAACSRRGVSKLVPKFV